MNENEENEADDSTRVASEGSETPKMCVDDEDAECENENEDA